MGKSREFLTMDIRFNMKDKSFRIDGDVKKELHGELISDFLRRQMGAGSDETKAVEKDEYRIRLTWYPQDDSFGVRYDTGNAGLRDGILYDILGRIR